MSMKRETKMNSKHLKLGNLPNLFKQESNDESQQIQEDLRARCNRYRHL